MLNNSEVLFINSALPPYSSAVKSHPIVITLSFDYCTNDKPEPNVSHFASFNIF